MFSRLAPLRLAAGMAAALAAGGATADEVVTGAEIAEAVRAALHAAGERAKPQVMAEKRFYRCDAPLDVRPAFDDWRTVRVACPAPAPWQLTLRTLPGDPAPRATPPDAPSPAAAVAVAVALSRPLRGGDRLTEADLVLLPVTRPAAATAFGRIEDLVGRKLRQPLPGGSVLQARHLERRWAVEAEDALTILVDRGAIAVATTGFALEPGQIGDTIRVRNGTSGQEIEARIVAEKLVHAIAKLSP